MMYITSQKCQIIPLGEITHRLRTTVLYICVLQGLQVSHLCFKWLACESRPGCCTICNVKNC